MDTSAVEEDMDDIEGTFDEEDEEEDQLDEDDEIGINRLRRIYQNLIFSKSPFTKETASF